MRILLVVVLLGTLGFLAAPAQAATLVSDEHFKYQQWLDDAKMPTPKRRVKFHLTGCFNGETEASCSFPRGGIWLARAHHEDKPVFLHEFGHQIDYWLMTDKRRFRFAALVGRPMQSANDWTGSNERVLLAETFASAWSLCARTPDHYDEVDETQYGWYPSEKLHRDVCGFLRALTPPKHPVGDRDFDF